MKRLVTALAFVLLIGLFQSFPGKESAFAGPITDRIVPFIKQSNTLVDTWNQNAEIADALVAAIQNAADTKAFTSLPILNSQISILPAKFTDDSNSLSALMRIHLSECGLLSAIDACNEFLDSNNAAKDAQAVARFSLALATTNLLALATTALQSAADKAAAELKAKQEAEAKKAAADKVIADKAAADKVIADKAAADKVIADKVIADAAAKAVKDKAIADKAAVKKPTTITCIKGKLTKKVTAVNPKCPKGYTLKP